MPPRDDDPRIALAGWAAGGLAMLTARGADLLSRADRVVLSGTIAGFDRADRRATEAPADARACAAALVAETRGGRRVVWLVDGDPLESYVGREIAEWLTATGAVWEYAPAADVRASRPGAIAHIPRVAVAPNNDKGAWASWSAAYPLLGRTIGVTRAAAQAAPLVAALAERGADPISCPTIEIADPSDSGRLDAALADPGRYSWAIFTSANGVERFFGRMGETCGDIRDLKGVRLAAIGPATAAALDARGVRVDLVPDEYVAEALFAALEREGGLAGSRILIARAAVARDVLPDALRAAGADVDVVETYRTIRPDGDRDLIAALVDNGALDLVTFTSSSTVTNFVALAGPDRARRTRAACIGPITSATARDAGMEVAVEAATYTVEGLVDAIVRWAARDSPKKGFDSQ